MLQIDGSEGGGQILRTALALSAVTGKAFRAINIRKTRPQPGLKAQHLHCIKALQQLCNAKVDGAELGSDSLEFIPETLKQKNLVIDIGTAGSIGLLLQALLLPCIYLKKIKLDITGGTDGKWAMPTDFLRNVFLPHIMKYADIECNLTKRGYFPKGQGHVTFKVKSKIGPKNITLLDQGKLLSIKGISHASLSLEKSKVAERQAMAARSIFKDADIRTEYQNTLSDGSGIVLWATFSKTDEIDFNNPVILGSDILGERGKKAEIVGEEAAKKLQREIESGACVDVHTADSIIPFLALFKGSIKVSKVTGHCKTNIYVCEKFLPVKFDIEDNIISAKPLTL